VRIAPAGRHCRRIALVGAAPAAIWRLAVRGGLTCGIFRGVGTIRHCDTARYRAGQRPASTAHFAAGRAGAAVKDQQAAHAAAILCRRIFPLAGK